MLGGSKTVDGAMYVRPMEHSSSHIGLVRVLGIFDRYFKSHNTGDTGTEKCQPRA